MDAKTLAKLSPISEIAPEHHKTLVDAAKQEDLKRKSIVFNEGDNDSDCVYLIDGVLRCTSASGSDREVSSSSSAAEYPIGNLLPRQFTATVHSKTASIVRIPRELIDQCLSWTQMGATESEAGVEVMDFSGGSVTTGQWMFGIMKSPLFRNLPTPNIERFFASVTRRDVTANELIIKQGDQGEHYFMIAAGDAQVFKKVGPAEISLAQLSIGDAFGEEALLSGQPRNASVRMTSDGVLMQLSRSDFESLLKSPNVSWINSKEVASRLKSGDCQLIDVRTEREFGGGSIKGAKNIPLYKIRQEVEQMAADTTQIVFCDTGNRSAAAAFILGERGKKALALTGGLASLKRR